MVALAPVQVVAALVLLALRLVAAAVLLLVWALLVSVLLAVTPWPRLRRLVALFRLLAAALLVVRLLALPQVLAPQVVAVPEVVAVEVEPLTRSFSAAMAGTSPSPVPPMYAPVPRSRRNPQCRPCPLT